jgi:hypothetical protein
MILSMDAQYNVTQEWFDRVNDIQCMLNMMLNMMWLNVHIFVFEDSMEMAEKD